MIGTMIELPRAALIADEIAKEAEFFSFGTNDLTQTTFGFSRDDAGKFISYYTENGILEKDPFQTLDQEGVGQLVKMGVEKGRKTRPNLKVGICGEHGGDPASVEFCFKNRAQLRELLALSCADRAARRGACQAQGEGRGRVGDQVESNKDDRGRLEKAALFVLLIYVKVMLYLFKTCFVCTNIDQISSPSRGGSRWGWVL